MTNFRKALVVSLLFTVAVCAQQNFPSVSNGSFISHHDPKIDLTIRGFKYVGSFDFTIPNIAKGKRYVYVDADRQKRVSRMFIIQAETIIPESNEIYRYSFANAERLGAHLFRHNTFAFSNAEGRRENPNGEGPLTVDFLAKKGFSLSDEWMASRFVAVPDPAKKSEIILFYMERVDRTGNSVTNFYNGQDPTPVWQKIAADLNSRSRKAFVVKS